MIYGNTAQGLLEAAAGETYGKTAAGSSFDFAADDWFLPEYASKNDHLTVRKIHIGFSGIQSPAVKLLVKQYAAWRLGRVKPVTVRTELSGRLAWWIRYLGDRKITDPAQFGAGHMCRFLVWLQKKDVRAEAVLRIARTAALLIETGRRLGWQVTQEPVMRYVSWQPVRGEKDNRKTEKFSGEEPLAAQKLPSGSGAAKACGAGHARGFARPIPEEIYQQIIRCAFCEEKDIITKAGILIQSQTGLRIGEVLSLKEGCLSGDKSGGFLLGYESKKTQKAEPILRYIPANAFVCDAVEELAAATTSLRAESGRRELFLVNNHGIRPASAANWNRGRLRSFLRRWGITALDGGEYPLHSHQFRATYVRRELLAGTGIETLCRQLGHVSPEMTAQYVHLETEELASFLAPCIGGKGGDGIG